MKIIEGINPTIVNPTGAKTEAQLSARERAIAALTRGTPMEERKPAPVAPEEIKAVSPPTVSRQPDTSEESSESPSTEATSPKSEPKSDSLSSQYAILARKEKALRAKVQAQESATKAKEDALRAKEEALKAREAEYASKYIPKEDVTKDPFGVLAGLGLTYEQLTELAMNAPKPQDVAREQEFKRLQDEIKSLRESQEKVSKSLEENQSQANQQAINMIKSDVRKLISVDPSYEMIKATNSVQDVVDLIQRTFNEDGELLSVEEASSLVEEYLEGEALRLSKLNKIQQKLKPNAALASKQAPTGKPKEQSSSTLKTLTNNVSGSGQLNARDRAILAFKGELKK